MNLVERLRDFAASMLSRKFLLVIVSVVVIVGNGLWDWGISDEQVWTILAPILTYLGVEGVADIKARKSSV